MTITDTGTNLGTRNLRDCRDFGRTIAKVPGVVQSPTAIAMTIASLIDERILNGGEERVRNGISEEAFTQSLAEDVIVRLGMWLQGTWEAIPCWPGYVELRIADYPEIQRPIESAACDMVDWIWDSHS
jgi:hypothetical protein